MSNARPTLLRPLTAILGIWLLTSATAGAQILNPRVVDFEPSPDHVAMLDDRTPAVTNYVLEIYKAGAITASYSMDIGKPDPDPDGRIRYDFSWSVPSWSLPAGYYKARVAAQGPQGLSRSTTASNEFMLMVSDGIACYFVLSATSVDVASWGETGALGLAAPRGCSWTATSDSAWLTPGTASGTGNAVISFGVKANPGPTIRTGGLTIAGQIVAITQALAPPIKPTGFKVVGTQK